MEKIHLDLCFLICKESFATDSKVFLKGELYRYLTLYDKDLILIEEKDCDLIEREGPPYVSEVYEAESFLVSPKYFTDYFYFLSSKTYANYKYLYDVITASVEERLSVFEKNKSKLTFNK